MAWREGETRVRGQDSLTRAHNTGKDPALSIFHRLPTLGRPLSQDGHTAIPFQRADALGVVLSPVPLKHTTVVIAVDLQRADREVSTASCRCPGCPRAGKVVALTMALTTLHTYTTLPL